MNVGVYCYKYLILNYNSYELCLVQGCCDVCT